MEAKPKYETVEIQAVSEKTQAVKINDQWYKVEPNVKLLEIKKGKARVGFKGNKVFYIAYKTINNAQTNESHSNSPKNQEFAQNSQKISKDIRIMRLAVLNSAIKTVETIPSITGDENNAIETILKVAEIYEKWVLEHKKGNLNESNKIDLEAQQPAEKEQYESFLD